MWQAQKYPCSIPPPPFKEKKKPSQRESTSTLHSPKVSTGHYLNQDKLYYTVKVLFSFSQKLPLHRYSQAVSNHIQSPYHAHASN